MNRAVRVSKRPRFGAFCIGLLLCWSTLAQAQSTPAAVASAHPAATDAGVEILRAGGNAFDAAVAVTAALAVVEPYSSGLGGGGFWLLHRAADGYQIMLDGRERAPLKARRDMYLDADGTVVPGLSVDGPLAAGIPGVPAALQQLAEDFGDLPLQRSLAPAIRLARQGFLVDDIYRRLAGFRLQALRASPAAAAIFLVDGEVPPEGHRIRQPDLARVLERIAAQGAAGFYQGPVAQAMVSGVVAAGGIWTHFDLAGYVTQLREPVRFEYRGARFVTAAPPSSGGVALATILQQLAGYDLPRLPPATRMHLTVEAMRRAYRDRAQYLGDPDHVEMPLRLLTSPDYAAGLRAGIRLDRATPSSALPGIEAALPGAGADTSHFSILDRQGNRVAATLSINYPFGSGFVPPGTGVLLNDEMDDFSIKPGAPNVYGLVGAEANAIEPSKRMLSSMTPTFIEQGSRLAVLGTPGGSRIITMVLLAGLAFNEGADAAAMVALPRYHHQYLPDRIEVEPGVLSEAELLELQWLGHEVQVRERPWGNMQVVIQDRDSGQVQAASDPRGIGTAVVLPQP